MKLGMATGSKVKVFGTSQYLYGISYYDDRGRVAQTINYNITTQVDVVHNQYDFSGKVLKQVLASAKILSTNRNDYLVKTYVYDNIQRLTSIKNRPLSFYNGNWIDGTDVETVRNEYDALGQLKKKKLEPSFNGVGLETLNYDYNIRGWLLGANRDYLKDAATNYFGFELGYDKARDYYLRTELYCSHSTMATLKEQFGKVFGDGEKRKYDFTYDAANRITSADFTQYTSSSFNKLAGVDFSMSGMSYDPNGNILRMKQRGLKIGGSYTIDSLNYNYITGSNKLLNVIDGVNDAQTILGDFRTQPASFQWRRIAQR